MMLSPTPEEVRKARTAAALTQLEAAEKVWSTVGAWKSWEAGRRTMPPTTWELFLLKTKLKRQFT